MNILFQTAEVHNSESIGDITQGKECEFCSAICQSRIPVLTTLTSYGMSRQVMLSGDFMLCGSCYDVILRGDSLLIQFQRISDKPNAVIFLETRSAQEGLRRINEAFKLPSGNAKKKKKKVFLETITAVIAALILLAILKAFNVI